MSDFEFIPAIDLLDGQVVRLFKGQYDSVTAYNPDPAEQVRQFVAAGARLIHLVDLNAARNADRRINRASLNAIRSAIDSSVQIQIGGGVRDLAVVQGYLDHGVNRVIIGTAAVRDPAFLEQAIKQYGPQRIIVGVDALDDQVRVAGWEENSKLALGDYLKRLSSQGVQEIIYTDIARDGALSGPHLEGMRYILENFGLRLIASGGVADLEDLRSLKELAPRGLVGVISGKAIYEGRINVRAALELCHAQS